MFGFLLALNPLTAPMSFGAVIVFLIILIVVSEAGLIPLAQAAEDKKKASGEVGGLSLTTGMVRGIMAGVGFVSIFAIPALLNMSIFNSGVKTGLNAARNVANRF